MPGYLLHQGATVLCSHGGQAQATAPNPRVKVSGQMTVTQPVPWMVAGCPFVPPAPGPCVTAQWITAAVRVRSNGMPLLLQDSVAMCAPTGTGVVVAMTQVRVRGV
ncbi:MAG TPA: hypothetical protein DEH78_08050 [Solibacterales bacterium]|nr:hypothetical protein [Bryobacterales bacterium]